MAATLHVGVMTALKRRVAAGKSWREWRRNGSAQAAKRAAKKGGDRRGGVKAWREDEWRRRRHGASHLGAPKASISRGESEKA